MSFNLAVILRESAHSSPDKPAALSAQGQLTYGNLTRPRTGLPRPWRPSE